MSYLSVIILTKDEEKNLPSALASLRGLDAKCFIVDSGSQDRTVEIAKEAGCLIAVHEFVNYAQQLNWAIDNLPINTEWVMRLDADERLMPELAEELKKTLCDPLLKANGIVIKRRNFFWGRWIRFGGYYPIWLLRIWRRGTARCENRHMDEHMVLDNGSLLYLKNDFIDENQKGLTFWTNKHNGYSSREAMDMLAPEAHIDRDRTAGQASRKRFWKERIYANSPKFLRAFLYWFFRYFLLLGFLDGLPGLVFHFLQGFWYRFLVDAKLNELERKAKQQ